MPNGPEEIKCNKSVTLNKDEKAASSQIATGATPQAARTNANASAQEAALREALAEISDYVCEDGCMPRIDLHLSRPDAKKPIKRPFPGVGFQTTATCDWTGNYACRRDPGQQAEVQAEEQEFLCTDPWTVIAEGIVTGKAETGKPPVGFVAEAALMAKLLKNLLVPLREKLTAAVSALRCPAVRCKNKEFRIFLWPAKTTVNGPNAAGNFTWEASQWYRVEAHCTPD